MNYIDKLNLLRISKGLSIRKLSNLCGLSEPSVKAILSQKGAPRISSIEKICEALNISLATVFSGSDETIFSSAKVPTDVITAFEKLSQEAKGHLLWIANNLKKP